MKTEIILVVQPNTEKDAGSLRFLYSEFESFGLPIDCESTTISESSMLAQYFASQDEETLLIFVGTPFGRTAPSICDAVCAAFKLTPVLDPDSWERVKEYHRNTGEDSTGAESMAIVPEDCTIFPNEHGAVPGYFIQSGKKKVLVFPGTSRELFPMFSDYVSPFLSNVLGGTVVSHTVGVFGVSEMQIISQLSDLMSELNPSVSVYPRDGEAVLRVTARAQSREEAHARCQPVIHEIKERFGVNVYGVDMGSLQKAVVVLLLDKHIKIATAESCTAGLLSAKLTEIAGVSSVFECGVAAYSGGMKQNLLGVPADLLAKFGAVSPQTATAMAMGVRKTGNANIGVGITGVAGPDDSEGKPVGTVFIALADDKRVWVKRMNVSDPGTDRDYIRNLATVYALDLVRRYLEAYPTVMAGGELLPSAVAEPKQEIPQTEISAEKTPVYKRLLPWKGDPASAVLIKTGAIAGVLALLAICLFTIYSFWLLPEENRQFYQNLQSMYVDGSASSFVPSADLNYPENMLNRFGALYTRNQDVRGWVYIENTGVNYPFMRYDPLYAQMNFDRAYSHYGVPYLIAGSMDFDSDSSRNYVIKGNNRDGQMFSDVAEYDKLEYLKQHPVIRLDTLYRADVQWQIFAVMLVSDPSLESSRFDYRKAVFSRASESALDAEFLEFAGNIERRSLYTFPRTFGAAEGDNLLMLVTDYHFGRTYNRFADAQIVVVARELREGEAPITDLADVGINRDALIPGDNAVNETETTLRRATDTEYEMTSTGTVQDETLSTEAITSIPDGMSTAATESQTAVGTTASASTTRQTTLSPTGTTTSGAGDPTQETGTTTTESTPTESSGSGPSVYAAKADESLFLKEFSFKEFGTGSVKKLSGSVSEMKEELQLQLARIVKSEIGSTKLMGNNLAAQKAQTVAAYTFILYQNMVEKKVPECPVSNISLSNSTDKKIYDAVGEVLGIKLLASDGKTPICTFYFASSPGRTLDNRYMFGQNLSHLRSVESKYDKDYTTGWASEYTVKMDDLKSALSAYYGGKAISFDDDKATPFYIKTHDPNGLFAQDTNLYYMNGTSKVYIQARMIRQVMGSSTLRSSSFTVASSTATDLRLSVKGYGHGVGMSQCGAGGYAEKEGWDFRRILGHYYSINGSSPHQLIYARWS